MRINIIARQNTAGLSVDIKILARIFERQGWSVEFSDYKSPKRYFPRIVKKYDINFFLQWADPAWLKHARKNILMPNPEWFKAKWINVIKRFDAVFCKTKVAVDIFLPENPNTIHTGFTSIDRYQPDISKINSHWLHVAGKSKLKGSDVILKTWLANPEFPHMTIIQRNAEVQIAPAVKNITYISDYISQPELDRLMNTCGVHLCPSQTEGYGHSISEALSCGALVVTTDAPPMNELVNEQRGFLVPPSTTRPLKLATAYTIDQQDLEATVRRAIKMTDPSPLMTNARTFFIANADRFRQQLVHHILTITGQTP